MPSILLMERAGLAAAQEILAGPAGPRARCRGRGAATTGATGWSSRRHLREAGMDRRGGGSRRWPPRARPTAPRWRRSPRASASAWRPSTPPAPHGPRVVVDALLGTGARGAAARARVGRRGVDRGARGPRGRARRALGRGRRHGPRGGRRGARRSHRDLPRRHGGPARGAGPRPVRARGGGRHRHPGRHHAGAGRVARGRRRDRRRAAQGRGADKYASGSVLVVAGSPGLTGAACLAARATLRAGAGLTVVAAPAGGGRRSSRPICSR